MDLHLTDSELKPSKLRGTYPQRQSGLFMQRIPMWGGRLTPSVLRGIAELAVKFTGGTGLHLTTRQSLELHNVRDADTPEVLRQLGILGLQTFGAGGDNVRTITVCPCCGTDPEAFDTEPLAEAVHARIAEHRPALRLPRKFKISFHGCRRPQSQPYANDLAFGAISETAVRVVGAGSLGARPEPGIQLYESLPIRDIPALVQAALALFDRYGDRENRRQARLRHVRQRFGDAEFMRVLEGFFQEAKKSERPFDLHLTKGQAGWIKHTFQIEAGELPPETAKLIADTVECEDARIRINMRHGIDLCTKKPVRFPDALNRFLDRPVITACPGNATCKNGIVNCRKMAEQLSAAFAGIPEFQGKTIALSGCPNNCSHSCIADIGLIGRLRTVDGEKQEACQILLHGDNGRTRKMAEAVEIAAAGELADRIHSLTAARF
jgi:sulfite reductase (ferredoxin)